MLKECQPQEDEPSEKQHLFDSLKSFDTLIETICEDFPFDDLLKKETNFFQVMVKNLIDGRDPIEQQEDKVD